MRYRETAHAVADRGPVSLDFARIWRAADKIAPGPSRERRFGSGTVYLCYRPA
jgi:hypothetical protein